VDAERCTRYRLANLSGHRAFAQSRRGRSPSRRHLLIGVSHPSFATTGGAEILLARQIAGMRALGHEMRLVTMSLDRERWPELVRDAEIRLAPKHWTDAFVPGLLRRQERRLRRQARQLQGTDAVLASGYPANVVASRVEGVRSVWYCNEPSRRLHFAATYPALVEQIRSTSPEHDSAMASHTRRRLASERAKHPGFDDLRAVDVEAVKCVQRVVANSQYAAALVERVYGRRPDAVINPTVPEPHRPGKKRIGIDRSGNGLRVLAHSRLELLKNVETVLRGYALFAELQPGAHELHVVGSGPDEPRLRAIVNASAVGDSVHFHGFVDDETMATIYDSCDVMALLPPDEPFGMVFPEAALRGLLLIGPDHGGPYEILDGGALGWVVDAFSADALADALAEVFHLDDGEVDRRRERAATECRDRYGEAATIPPLLALLHGT
jgi:glycosyltransferase involved in cell wall biosynthesis